MFVYDDHSIFAKKLISNTPMGVKEILLERRERVGMEKGIERGREMVLAEILEEMKTRARNLKKKAVDLDVISEATGLSLEEIKSL